MSADLSLGLNLVLFGPPGAGKGTLASRLFEDNPDGAPPCLATGDHLRSIVASGDERSPMLRKYMDAGELVPDELIIAEVGNYFERGEFDRGFVLDGFPRTEVQAKFLEGVLSERGLDEIALVVYIDVSDETVLARLTTRRVCSSCGAIYNVVSNPPPASGECGTCGGRIVQRSDDTVETISRRLSVYKAQIGSILDFYERRGQLLRVDGELGSEKVLRAVLDRLAS